MFVTYKQGEIKRYPTTNPPDDSGIGQPTASVTTLQSDSQATASVTVTGPDSAKEFNFQFGIPKGPKGEPGPANTLSVGTVVSGEAASAVITGEAPSQTLNLVLPKGDKGDKGDKGENFNVDQVGNLDQKSQYDDQLQGFSFLAADTGDLYIKLSDTSGDWSEPIPFQGPKGDSALSFQIGTVTTLDSDSEADVAAVTDSDGLVTLSFGIPRGSQGVPGKAGVGISSVQLTGSSGLVDTYTITFTDDSTTAFDVTNGADGSDGQPGPGNSIAIGTVTSGSDASATITGQSPNQALNLVLPKGDPGTGITIRGQYSSDSTYRKTDLAADAVQYKGSLWGYINDIADSGNPPPETQDAVSNEYWTLLVAKGNTGEAGITPEIDSDTGNWIIGNIDTGVCANALLASGSLTFSSVQNNIATLATSSVPVGIRTDKGNYYPVQKGSVVINISEGNVQLDVSNYLIYDNSASFSGTWRAYFASGQKGDQGNNALSFQIGTVTTLSPGSDAAVTATVSEDGLVTLNLGIPKGIDGVTPAIDPESGNWIVNGVDTGICANIQLVNSSVTFSSVSGDIATISTSSIPVGVQTDKGNYYPVQKGSLQIDTSNGKVYLDVSPYLAYEGQSQFSGTWRVYFALGEKGEQGQKGNNALSFQIGEVTTLPAGSQATATAVTDTQGLVTLNLGIPQGTAGDSGALSYSVVSEIPSDLSGYADGHIFIVE